jgi:cell division septum initiation protein DivIVA
MGFSFESDTGLPVVAGPEQSTAERPTPLTLHVTPEVGTATVDTAPVPLHLQPPPTAPPQVLPPPPAAAQVQAPAGAASEAEIGSIMLQLQRFADESAEEARRKADEVIAAAEAQAAAMIQRASETATSAQAMLQSAQAEAQAVVQAALADAQAITERAHYRSAQTAPSPTPSISPDTVATLSAAIEEFARTNSDLVAELAQLRQSLTSGPAGVDPQYVDQQPTAFSPDATGQGHGVPLESYPTVSDRQYPTAPIQAHPTGAAHQQPAPQPPTYPTEHYPASAALGNQVGSQQEYLTPPVTAY